MASIEKDGRRWRVRYDAPRGPDGARRQRMKRGFPTRRTAEAWARDTLGRMDRGTWVPPKRITLDAWLDLWLDPAAPRKRPIRPTTLTTYRIYADTYLRPRLGHRQLQSLTADDLDRLYRDLLVGGGRAGRPLAPKTVRHVHVLAHTCLAAAVRKGHLEHNPANRADPPSVPHHRPAVWWPDDLQAFLASVQADRLAALWMLAATTGMRRAELLGLAWDALDLDAKPARLEVRRTVVLVEGQPVLVEATKTAHGRRSFALDPATVAALKAHRTRQLAERLAWGGGWQDTGLVFTREDGSLIDPRWLTKAFTRTAKAAGLPRLSLHGLRHSYASNALRAGVPVEVVSGRIGHAQVSTTLDIYVTTHEAQDADAAERVAAVILGADVINR
jgi:integrase